MHAATRRAIFRRLAAANPEPKTELEHSSAFELLVAVMLSAHTTDRSVNAATRKLFPVANTPEAILALGEEGVKPYLKSVGLYNSKSRNLIGLCRMLVELHGGKVPANRDALEALPGVGRKTANVVLNIIFGETEIAVDTHIFRVANRTGLAPGKTPRAVEDALNENTPAEFKLNAHHWLILHGRYVCTARLPACPKCIIRDLCEYTLKTIAAPAKKERRSQRDFPGSSKTGARRTAPSGSCQDGKSPAFRAEQESEMRGKRLRPLRPAVASEGAAGNRPGTDSRGSRKVPLRATLRARKSPKTAIE
ncbi:MAG TPA: endonuclease III [Steroidobacteraceae bacterium]|nr:endonuclease III [Steroidobacteraceae bacterium]